MTLNHKVRLGDVCNISSALIDPRDTQHLSTPHIGGANIESMSGNLIDLKTAEEEGLKSGKFLFDERMVLYSKIRPYLMKVARPDFVGLCSADIYPLLPVEGIIDRDYLFHLLLTPSFTEYAITGSARAGMPKVNRTHLFEFRFDLPPLPEQQRIVGILDEAFEGIATAKANAAQNLQSARALFESHLQAVFSQRGEGWVEKKLGDESVLQIIDGDRGANYPKAEEFHDAEHCLFLNTKNVRPNGFEFESTMFITAEKDALLRKGKLKRNDVVLTTRGTIGNIGYYTDDIPFDNIRINSGMLIFRANANLLLPSFLFELLRSAIVKDQIRMNTTGAAQPQLPIKTLVNFTIPVPTLLEDQSALVNKIRAIEPETQRLESVYQRKLAALDDLKKSLLHLAFNGEL